MLRLASHLARTIWPEIRLLPLRAAVALGSAGLSEPPRPARLRQSFAIILPIALATWWAIPRLTWVMSPSIDAWAVRPAAGPVRKGDYVMFLLSHPLAGPRPVSVTKQALCLPGEVLTEIEKPSSSAFGRLDGYYYCDAVLLGISKPIGRDGKRLDRFHWGSRQIPPGFAYVGSHHPDGFDSRYYGPIAIDRLTRMERVL